MFRYLLCGDKDTLLRMLRGQHGLLMASRSHAAVLMFRSAVALIILRGSKNVMFQFLDAERDSPTGAHWNRAKQAYA